MIVQTTAARNLHVQVNILQINDNRIVGQLAQGRLLEADREYAPLAVGILTAQAIMF